MEILRWRFVWFFSSYCMKEIIKLMSLQQIAGRLRRHEPKKITGLELDRMKKFKMIRDELKFDYTINFVYISSIETLFFNRKNQDQKRLESAYWERKEDNGHDKRDMRFFLLWFKKRKRVSKVDAGAENSTPLVFILKPEVVPRERCDARRETLCLMPLDADAELAHHGYVSLFSSV